MENSELTEHKVSKIEAFRIDYWPDAIYIDASQENNDFDKRLFEVIEEAKTEQADKILSRLSVIFTDYKNAGFENSAQVTKYIMNEIETLVK